MARRPGSRVDLGKVRAARARLGQLAAQHPELTGPSGSANRAGWEAALMEKAMGNSEVVSLRVPPEILTRIDQQSQRLTRLTGLDVSRADVVKMLLTRGLTEVEREALAETELAKRDLARSTSRAANRRPKK